MLANHMYIIDKTTVMLAHDRWLLQLFTTLDATVSLNMSDFPERVAHGAGCSPRILENLNSLSGGLGARSSDPASAPPLSGEIRDFHPHNRLVRGIHGEAC